MNRKILLILLVITLIVVPSCGLYEAAENALALQKRLKKTAAAKGQDETQENRGGEGLVTLIPPYGRWDLDKRGAGKLTVQNVVWAITRQVGVRYNWEKSYKNTQPLCRTYISPNYKDKPWRKAIDEALAPVDLTYVMENNEVLLLKIEDAHRREQQIQQLKDDIDAFIASGAALQKIPDGVIVFPLLDSQARTTNMGTLLAELGMLKATYVPQKIMNLHVPSVIELYHDYGYDQPGRSMTVKQRNRIIGRFRTPDTASGTLDIGGGRFTISLSVNGRNGRKEFSTTGAEAQLYDIPQWIARCVHEYRGTVLSSSQQQYMNSPEIRDRSSLLDLAEMERKYGSGLKDAWPWRRLLRKNPDCSFALYRLFQVSEYEKPDRSLDEVTAALARNEGHDLLKFLEASWYQRNEDYQTAVVSYFELLKRDLANEALFERLDETLLALGLGENAEILHGLWEKNDPESYLPLLARGTFYIDYAWNARGHGWAGSVREEDWKKFDQRLRLSEQYLKRALDLNPGDPRIATDLIRVAIGLHDDREQMEQWFQDAIQADPAYYEAYKAKLTYLKPKWHGDPGGREMFAFARECAANPPEGSDVALILLSAHSEMAYRWADRHGGTWKDYYAQPEVWKEVKAFYERYLREHPDSITSRNYYAKLACFAHDYETAVGQFKILGKDIDKECWSEKFFYLSRTEAYKNTGRI